jgi:hypothetical protein
MASLWETYIDPDVDNRTEAMHTLCDEIDQRLSALEHNSGGLTDDERRQQDALWGLHPELWSAPTQPSEAKPDGRKWIDIENDMVWTYWQDGQIFLYRICDYLKHKSNLTLTHVMPYHPGDPKPEPPKGDR